MIPKIRDHFNQHFSEAQYLAMIADINKSCDNCLDFRVCETPIFFSKPFTRELIKAGETIVEEIRSPKLLAQTDRGIPEGMFVPNPPPHPDFLAIDFAITRDDDGNFIPKLIELQAFPTTFCFEYFLDQKIREYFKIPPSFSCYFNGINRSEFLAHLRNILLGNHQPENVILLEVNPDAQKTRIDFALTEQFFGIKTVCVTKILQRGKRLFYRHSGKEIAIQRIYNRVIFDELILKKVDYHFHFRDELQVEWAGHPNWFFKISKFILPLLRNPYTPECYYLSELTRYPGDLHNYVLKPLFSFAGSGVQMDVSKSALDSIDNRANYILQQKVEYAPFLKTPDNPASAEVRLIYFWRDKPRLMTSHVRVSKGRMMGVDFNKRQKWVGSTIGYHPLV